MTNRASPVALDAQRRGIEAGREVAGAISALSPGGRSTWMTRVTVAPSG